MSGARADLFGGLADDVPDRRAGGAGALDRRAARLAGDALALRLRLGARARGLIRAQPPKAPPSSHSQKLMLTTDAAVPISTALAAAPCARLYMVANT